MSTYITVTSGTGALVNRVKQVQQASREAQLQRERDLPLQGKLTAEVIERDQVLQPRGGNPDTSIQRRPAAQRGGFALAYVGSGFNSSLAVNTKSYAPPSLYPLYPGEATEAVWNQIAAGSLRFVVGSNSFQAINQAVPAFSNGYVWRLASNRQILIRAWNYTRDGGYPPVAEMLLTDTWGGRYVAPRHPMVTSRDGVLWLTWEYRLDLATQYTLAADNSGVQYTVGNYAYQNKILFVRYDTRSRVLEQKLLSYSQFQSANQYAAMFLANCFEDDPSKQVRALGYKNEYHLRQNKAYFLRAVSSGLPITYPYTALKNATTGKITSDGWRVVAKPITATTPSTLVAELNAMAQSDEPPLAGKATAVRFSASGYDNLGASLFEGTGVAPVPSALGLATNTQLPVLVL